MRERLWVMGWIVSAVLGAVIYSDFVAHVFVAEYADSSEKNCRSHEQARITKQRAAAQKDLVGTNSEEAQDPEKAAREYCVQRRAAIAAERQAEFTMAGLVVGFFALVAAALAAGAAFSAAGATRDSVSKIDDTARRQLRAYVSVEPEGMLRSLRKTASRNL